jgi:hypothetical protein
MSPDPNILTDNFILMVPKQIFSGCTERCNQTLFINHDHSIGNGCKYGTHHGLTISKRRLRGMFIDCNIINIRRHSFCRSFLLIIRLL